MPGAGERDAGSKPPDVAEHDEARGSAASDPLDRPNLEPISDAAHPPQNRRLPTQPPINLVFGHEPPPDQARPSPRPSPTPVRRGLFSSKRSINLAAGVVVGLLLASFPAMKLAQRLDTREHESSPGQGGSGDEASAAANDEARNEAPGRFLLTWLLIGLPLGLGLGFAPRPGD